MNGKTSSLLTIAICLLCAGSLSAQTPAAPTAPAVPVELKVPAGFQASVFASGIAGARLMAVAPDGTLYVAKQGTGEVVALPDKNKDGKADETIVVAKGLARPHSLAFHKGYLYIATNPAVVRMKYNNGKVEGTPEKFVDLPVSTTSHWTRTIAWGKDNRLYVLARRATSAKKRTRGATIMVFNEDSSGGKAFAKGLRNAIGIDFDPKTSKLWGGDMGQDKLGEGLPGDEINLIEEGTKHYGFPYFIGNNVPNPDLKDAKEAR
ncbi:MAG: PQQ-dependent sugar dehydrogenase [Blastocatellia bacterium]